MGRKSAHGLPPGIHLDRKGVYWASLEGRYSAEWRDRYPGQSLPRRRAKDLRGALDAQRELIASLKTGQNLQAENPTVADWVERWVDGRRLAPRTKKRYMQSHRWQIKAMRIGRLRLRQLTHDHVRQWVAELEHTPTRGSLKGTTLDPYSIRNAFAVLRGALNNAVRGGLIPSNPCRGIELPAPDDEEIQPMTVEQIERFLAVVDKHDKGRPHRQAALYHIAIRCGLRYGEFSGLRWIDVDLKNRVLRVVGQFQDGKRKRGKTPRAHRTLPLTPSLVEQLKAHQLNQQSEQSVSHERWNERGLVFCSEVGTPIGESNLRRQYCALQRRAGLIQPCEKCAASGKIQGRKCRRCEGTGKAALFRVHDMRHTYAALAIAAGVEMYTLSRRMGHESITTTADRYGHLYKGHDDDAAAIERLLKGGEHASE
jgi:integrase